MGEAAREIPAVPPAVSRLLSFFLEVLSLVVRTTDLAASLPFGFTIYYGE